MANENPLPIPLQSLKEKLMAKSQSPKISQISLYEGIPGLVQILTFITYPYMKCLRITYVRKEEKSHLYYLCDNSSLSTTDQLYVFLPVALKFKIHE